MLLGTSGLASYLDDTDLGHPYGVALLRDASTRMAHNYILAQLVPPRLSYRAGRGEALSCAADMLSARNVQVVSSRVAEEVESHGYGARRVQVPRLRSHAGSNRDTGRFACPVPPMWSGDGGSQARRGSRCAAPPGRFSAGFRALVESQRAPGPTEPAPPRCGCGEETCP